MSPLMYLTARKLKNRFKEFIKTPSEFFPVVLLILLLSASVFTSSGYELSGLRSTNELLAIVFAVYSVVFVLICKNGFINGASMFSMADVNLIFTSPIKESKVLFYGLIQQLDRCLSFGFVILYQTQTIKNIYGLSFFAVIFIFIGYVLTAFLAQMLAMIIYTLTCSDDKKSRSGKIIFYGVIGIFLTYLLAEIIPSGFTIENIINSVSSPIMKFFPVSGIITLAIEGALEKNFIYVGAGLIYIILFSAAYYLIIARLKKDYYEDVLTATEISFSAINARKEGKAQETAPRNVKVGKTGLNQGYGSSVIPAKHKIENRRSRIFLVSLSTLVSVFLSVAFAYISQGDLLLTFIMNVYILTITVNEGRWSKELRLPYIYLIPEKPFKKLLNLIKGDLPSLFLESILVSVSDFLIIHCSALEALLMAIARFFFGTMLMGVNLLLQRLFGSSEKKLLTAMLYFLLILLFTAPTVAAGIFTSIHYPFFFVIPFLVMSASGFITTIILIFLSRNTLEYSEYNNK